MEPLINQNSAPTKSILSNFTHKENPSDFNTDGFIIIPAIYYYLN